MRVSLQYRLAIASLLGWSILHLGCSHTPSMAVRKPSAESLPFYRFKSTPIIVVARILENIEIGPSHPSGWDPHISVQLYRVKARTENVLKGEIIPSSIEIYYFSEVGAIGGPPRLGMTSAGGTWNIGDREMFFLERESGVLRTICDCMHYCVIPVLTGEHPGFKTERSAPLALSITNLLLTRGKGCGDLDMIRAIQQMPNFDRIYTIRKLKELASTETRGVREAACDALETLGNTCAQPGAGASR